MASLLVTSVEVQRGRSRYQHLPCDEMGIRYQGIKSLPKTKRMSDFSQNKFKTPRCLVFGKEMLTIFLNLRISYIDDYVEKSCMHLYV